MATMAGPRPSVPNYAKGKRSNKPPVVKAAVITRRIQGVNKTQIAKELKLGRPTVDAILAEADVDGQFASGLSLCAGLIPESVRVIKHRLEKNSESAAFGILNPLVLSRAAQANPQRMTADVHLQQAINVLIQPNSTQVVDTETVKPAREDPNLT